VGHQDDWLAAVTNTGRMIVFAVGDLPQMEKGKGDKILGIPGAKVQKREEYLIGIAVFKEGQQLMLRTGKGELKLRSGNDIDQYVSERGLRGSKLPRGHQEAKEIEAVEK
jgi:topoisomerase IV subunit A